MEYNTIDSTVVRDFLAIGRLMTGRSKSESQGHWFQIQMSALTQSPMATRGIWLQEYLGVVRRDVFLSL